MRYCLTCGYDLRGLREGRCPECARAFDPENPESFGRGHPPGTVRRWLAQLGLGSVLLVLVLMWFDDALFCILPLGTGAACVIAGRAAWRGRALPLVVLLALNPYLFAFIGGLREYQAGTARLDQANNSAAYSLDPVYRCGRGPAGDCVLVRSPLAAGSHDAAVRWAIRIWGYMPGSYVGPYPTLDEARQALAAGTAVDPVELRNGQVTIGGKLFTLTGMYRALTADRAWREFFFNAQADGAAAPGEIRAVLFKQGCLIVGVQQTCQAAEGAPRPVLVILIDAATGQPFAYLCDGDCCRPRLGR